jgi:putative hemolysin
MKRFAIVTLMVVASALVACGGGATSAPTNALPPSAQPAAPTQAAATAAATDTTLESPLGLPNPASTYCEDQGYKLEIRDEAGGQVGYCIFPNGATCEEWAFYRGECTMPETYP